MRTFIASAALLCLAQPAIASRADAGNASGVIAMSGGVILFNQAGPRTSPPSCGSQIPARWAFNGANLTGQSMLATLLSAWASQKRIFVFGTGTCSVWGDTETVDYIGVVD